MTSLTTGQAIVESLLLHEVDTVFGIPGAHTYDLFDALHASRSRFTRRARLSPAVIKKRLVSGSTPHSVSKWPIRIEQPSRLPVTAVSYSACRNSQPQRNIASVWLSAYSTTTPTATCGAIN